MKVNVQYERRSQTSVDQARSNPPLSHQCILIYKRGKISHYKTTNSTAQKPALRSILTPQITSTTNYRTFPHLYLPSKWHRSEHFYISTFLPIKVIQKWTFLHTYLQSDTKVNISTSLPTFKVIQKWTLLHSTYLPSKWYRSEHFYISTTQIYKLKVIQKWTFLHFYHSYHSKLQFQKW